MAFITTLSLYFVFFPVVLCCTTPYDGMVVSSSCSLCSGEYNFTYGLIVESSDITIDMQDNVFIHGPVLDNGGYNMGIMIDGYSNVTINGGTVSGFYYGIFARNSKSLRIEHMGSSSL